MTLKQKGFISVGAVIFMLLGMPFASSIWIKYSAAGSLYQTVREIPQAEAGVVLGAAAYSAHSLSPALQDRMDTAIELQKEDKVQKLILTGAKNEVIAMENYALDRGLKESELIIDGNGFNTLASIQNIPPEIKSVILITQNFHLPRALFYARHSGFSAVGLAADKREYADAFRFKKRELLANTKAMFDVFVTPRYNHLTEKFD